jgi:hypothetical protein
MFAALERLNDESLSNEQVKEEVDKAKAISSIGSVIINSAKIEVDYLKATGRIDSDSDIFKNIDTKKQLL